MGSGFSALHLQRLTGLYGCPSDWLTASWQAICAHKPDQTIGPPKGAHQYICLERDKLVKWFLLPIIMCIGSAKYWNYISRTIHTFYVIANNGDGGGIDRNCTKSPEKCNEYFRKRIKITKRWKAALDSLLHADMKPYDIVINCPWTLFRLSDLESSTVAGPAWPPSTRSEPIE